jgi:hypothetical protein
VCVEAPTRRTEAPTRGSEPETSSSEALTSCALAPTTSKPRPDVLPLRGLAVYRSSHVVGPRSHVVESSSRRTGRSLKRRGDELRRRRSSPPHPRKPPPTTSTVGDTSSDVLPTAAAVILTLSPLETASWILRETTWFQSPSPAFTTARTWKQWVTLTMRPRISVFAWSVLGALVHVFWSVEYCHSWAALGAPGAPTTRSGEAFLPPFSLLTFRVHAKRNGRTQVSYAYEFLCGRSPAAPF